MKKIFAIVELLRVKHWIKNLLVFVPMFCAKAFDIEIFWPVFFGFFAFSFLSSFVYVINDIKDLEKDRAHPRKKKRPLPSGRISKKEALIIAMVIFCLSLVLEFVAQGAFLNSALYFYIAYMFINLAYSFGLKNEAILDVVLLSAGFVVRIYYGSMLADVQVSEWLFLTVLSASMFLSLGKRKKELSIGSSVRKTLKNYNKDFLDKFMTVFIALVFVFYSLWAIEQNNIYITMTIPIVMIIFMKYYLDVEKMDEGDPTTVLYNDRILLLLCLIYVVVMGIAFVFL